MPFLIASDYKKQIQSDNLQQIIGNDTTILTSAEDFAINTVKGKLVQKYDITNAFQDLTKWDPTQVYKASNRVYLDGDAYNATSTYNTGAYVVYNGNFYICTGTTTGTFDPTKWTSIGAQYQIFFVQYPFQVFDYNTQYSTGDQVFWKDKIYTALVSTVLLSQNSALQYGSYQSLPLPNLSPDNVNAVQIWGTGTPYTVAAGVAITDTTKWTMGDNRSKEIVKYVIDIVIYQLSLRFAPRNVPELRAAAYHDALRWLDKVAADGDATVVDLPVLQPKQGARIRYGGNVKLVNSY